MPRPTTMGARKMVSLSPEMAEKIEDFRHERRYSTEADAIRELIRLGLEAAGQGEKAKERVS